MDNLSENFKNYLDEKHKKILRIILVVGHTWRVIFSRAK
jgi:hypothetical protein